MFDPVLSGLNAVLVAASMAAIFAMTLLYLRITVLFPVSVFIYGDCRTLEDRLFARFGKTRQR